LSFKLLRFLLDSFFPVRRDELPLQFPHPALQVFDRLSVDVGVHKFVVALDVGDLHALDADLLLVQLSIRHVQAVNQALAIFCFLLALRLVPREHQ